MMVHRQSAQLGLTPLAHAKRLRGLIRQARGNAFLATRDAEQGHCQSALANFERAIFQHGLLHAHQESIGKSRTKQSEPYYRRIVGRIQTNQAEVIHARAAVEKFCLRKGGGR